MGTDIGLGIQLRANAQGLQADLNKASKVVESWKGQMESIMAGGLQVAGVSAALAVFSGIAEKFREISREAAGLGVTIQELKGLKLFAKGDFDQLSTVLQRVQAELGAAEDGSEEARTKFEKLGLSWKALAGESPVAMLGELSAAYKNLGSQIEKANFARQIGGRGNQGAVMAMLEKGPEAIGKGQERAGGFFNEQYNDFLERHARGWQLVKDYAIDFDRELKDMVGWYAKLISKVDELEGKESFKRSKEVQTGQQDRMAKILAESKDVLTGPSADFLKLRDQFSKDIAAHGGKAGQIEAATATPAEKDKLRLMQDEDEWIKRLNDRRREAARIIEATMSPLERLNKEFEELQEMLQSGLLTMEQFERGTGAALDKSGLGDVKGDQPLPPALQVGSLEAQRFLSQQDMNGQQNPVVDKMEQVRALVAQLVAQGGQVAHL